MSYIEPPTLTNLRKRKRSARSVSVVSSIDSFTQHLPSDTIDPHSQGPSTRRQLAVAGLSHSDRLPKDYIADFPHRALPGGFGNDSEAKVSRNRRGSDDGNSSNADDTDSDESPDSEHSESGVNDTTEDEGGSDSDPARNAARLAAKQRKARRREAKRRRNAHRTQRVLDRNIGLLSSIVQRGLQEAEHGTLMSPLGGGRPDEAVPIGLARAKRAFGLLARTEVYGKPVDLRRNYLWAMGAEILMREGEDEAEQQQGSRRRRRRWGSAANLARVRAFYEELIHQYPYNRLWPRSVSALTFWPAMVGTELYSIHADAQLATERLDKADKKERKEKKKQDRQRYNASPDADGEEFYDAQYDSNEEGDGSDSDDAAGDKRHIIRRQRHHPNRLAREDIRLTALEQVRDVARRMDAVMANAPYDTSPEMLRLRGMVSLFMGDLCLVTPPRTQQEAREGEKQWAQERARARARFARLLEVDKEIQSGRHLSKRKGGATGIPDTVVDDYVRKMAQRHPSQRGLDDNKEEEDDDDDDDDEREGENQSYMAMPLFTSLPIRNS